MVITRSAASYKPTKGETNAKQKGNYKSLKLCELKDSFSALHKEQSFQTRASYTSERFSRDPLEVK
jgi:hypothetical protein